jgi:hypothetical protein
MQRFRGALPGMLHDDRIETATTFSKLLHASKKASFARVFCRKSLIPSSFPRIWT